MVERWKREGGQDRAVSKLGTIRHLPQWTDYQPTMKEARNASRFRGKVNDDAVDMLMSGQYANTSTKVIATDIVKQWRPGTIAAKETAVTAFFSFLTAIGALDRFFPKDGSVPVKSDTRSREEEHSLCQFAMLRMTAGQNMAGAGGMVAHIRTWYRVLYDAEFGRVGRLGRPSMTSQYLKAMGEYFPPSDTAYMRRDPVTWSMVCMFVEEAKVRKWRDVGVAVAVAYAALLRMGEATNSESRVYDAAEDLAERHLLFLPSFWTADKIEIRLGRTKADQTGARAKRRPRVIPVDGRAESPGNLLRDLVIRRHGLKRGQNPVLGGAPLFQNRHGGQLQRDAVLRFMRSTLRAAGFDEASVMRIGTHSCRIGGATRLFQLGASAEVMKQFGGWISDAYKAYVRIEQDDLMRNTCAMCT